MSKSWFAVITSELLYDKNLTAQQKILVAVINNLRNDTGYCFAKNKYLGECLCVSERTIQRELTVLEEKGYVSKVFEIDSNRSTKHRFLTVNDTKITPMTNLTPPTTNGAYRGDRLCSSIYKDSNNKDNIYYNNKGKEDLFIKIAVFKSKHLENEKVLDGISKTVNISKSLVIKKLDEFENVLIAQGKEEDTYIKFSGYFLNWLKYYNNNNPFKYKKTINGKTNYDELR